MLQLPKIQLGGFFRDAVAFINGADGGEGSGNHNHKGRPGQRGGSGGGGSSEDHTEQALKNLDELEDFRGDPELKKNPLFTKVRQENSRDDYWNIFHDVRDVADLYARKDISAGPVENIKVSDLRSVQPDIRTAGVKNAITKSEPHTASSDYPVGYRYNDKVYILDGNHRAVAAMLQGQDEIQMRIVKY